MDIMRAKLWRCGLVAITFFWFCNNSGGGSLEPSVPPGPTMKTLDEVEARIPIRPSDMPITIGNPGSYYLTGNFTAGAATHAVFVNAEHVTVDLNGYSLDGNRVGTHAIYINADIKTTTIRNGYIHNWTGMGVNGEEAERTYLENVHVAATTNEGVYLGPSSIAVQCSTTGCQRGFVLGGNSILKRCTARNNTLNGFLTTSTCMVTECVASGNGTNGLEAMKTLVQVEPRTPIQSLPGDVNYEYIISSSGSYYLTGNVSTAKSGIKVEVDDVTIDLMGYTLKGPDAGANDGVFMSARKNVEIRNGTVRDFYYGIRADSWGYDHRVVDVRVVSNRLTGIYLYGYRHLVKNCTASDNGDSASGTIYGIYVPQDSRVTGSTVCKNGYSATGTVYGIYAGTGSAVIENTVSENGHSLTGGVYGIDATWKSTVSHNMVRGNGYSASGDVYGIDAGLGCTVTGNTVDTSGDAAGGSVYGIRVTSGTIGGNTSFDNGYQATGLYVYGIHAGQRCTVIGNAASANGVQASGTSYGIYLSGNNLVDQNTASGNQGTNMNDQGNCSYGTNVPQLPLP